jgi:hypothetical protein
LLNDLGGAALRVTTMVLQTVQILISLAAVFATIWFLLLHAKRTWVWCRRLGIDDRDCSIWVLLQLLIGVTMLFSVLASALEEKKNDSIIPCTYSLVILESILVLVGLFASDDGTLEWLIIDFRHLQVWSACEASRQLWRVASSHTHLDSLTQSPHLGGGQTVQTVRTVECLAWLVNATHIQAQIWSSSMVSLVTTKASVYRHSTDIVVWEKVGELLVVLHCQRCSWSRRFGRKLVEGLVMLLLLLYGLEILCQERRLWSVGGLEG